MQFLRKCAVAAAASLLVLLLFGLGLAWSLHQVFGSPQDIKGALRGSGIYQSVMGEVLDHAQKGQSTPTGIVPVSQPDVRTIIEKAFPPSFLQGQTEQILDASYAWANGHTRSLQFSIDLTTAKQQLAEGLQQYVVTRLANLPVCTASAVPAATIDAYSATCVPPGFDKNAAAAQVKDDILYGDFLKNATITPSSIKDSNGKTLDQQLQGVPKAYRRTKTGIYLSEVLAVLLAASIVALSRPWRAGARKVAVIAIVVGAVSALFAWAGSTAVQRIATKIADSQNADQQLQNQLTTLVKMLTNEVCTWWTWYGLALLVLGAAALVVLYFTKPKGIEPTTGQPEPNITAQEQPAAEATPTAKPATPKPPAPKKRPRLVT